MIMNGTSLFWGLAALKKKKEKDNLEVTHFNVGQKICTKNYFKKLD